MEGRLILDRPNVDKYCPRQSMQKGFTKLFNTIVTSTIWSEDDKTRIIWITILAICDRYGDVSASIPGLAKVANVSIDATEKAIKNLMSPDEWSRTKDHEGRRIKEIDGGWHVYNYEKYRDMLNAEERKQYKAMKEQERRDRLKLAVDKRGQSVDSSGHRGHNAESRVQRADMQKQSVLSLEKKEPKKASVRPKLEEAIAYGKEIGLGKEAVESWFDHFESNGWKVSGKTPMVDWQASLRQAKRRGPIFQSGEKNSGKQFGKPQRPSRQTEAELWYDKTYGKTQRDG